MSTVVNDSAKQTQTISVMLIGNPNTGKTTLFNALTGLRHQVGNYPGVTVETKTGHARRDGVHLIITDVPGTYSLAPRSVDEMLTIDLLLGARAETARPDVIVCIVDASNIERNLYLATQVFELGLPTVIALNMMDVAKSRGIRIDVGRLAESLGVPVVPIQANAGRGISELTARLVETARAASLPTKPTFPEAFRTKANELAQWVASRDGHAFHAYLAERALLDVGGYAEKRLTHHLGPDCAEQLSAARAELRGMGCPIPAVEARTRYAWIAQRLAGAVEKPIERKVTLSDRIDRILVHRVWGIVVFLLLMGIVFQSIYSWAGFLMDPIESSFAWLGEVVAQWLPEGAFRELVVQGVIAGVGNVLIFLPQIMILFGFIAILEDCGYMARAAFLMDKVMSRCGLSGRSFIPLLSSFACAIPGVMATRTIEDRRDRFATVLVAPLMSCSARLPVYVLLIGTFIPATFWLGFISLQGLVLFSMYLIGLVLAPLIAWILKRTMLRGDAPVFLMELPSYKVPSLRTVIERMIDRGWAFAKRAGTLILATTIVIWALQYYPRPASVEAAYASEREAIGQLEAAGAAPELIEEKNLSLENRIAAAYQEQSFLGRMGKAIEPVVKPLGWDWRIGMAAIAAFPAREVVVSAMGTIFSVGGDVDEESLTLRESLKAATWPDGAPLFTPIVALSLMVFFALCCQCGATLAIIKRETNSWRWPIFTFVYMTVLAYVAALAVYQIGHRFI